MPPFCDRALLLEGGRIVIAGPADAVADRYMALLTEPPMPQEPVAPVAL